MRTWMAVTWLLAAPLAAQTPHQQRLDGLVAAATAILVAQAAPSPHGRPLWCVAPETPTQRVHTWSPRGHWLWCFPADVAPDWAGPWR